MARDYDIESILGVPFEETPDTLAYDLSSKFSTQVSLILEEKGMSLKDLSKSMGISQPTLCKMLGRRSNLTMKTIAKIAIALGCDVDEPRLTPKQEDSDSHTLMQTIVLNNIKFNRHCPRKWQTSRLDATIKEG